MAQGGISITRQESEGLSWEQVEPTTMPAGLAPYIARICGYRERVAAPQVRREVPVAGVTLIIGLGDPVEVTLPTSRAPERFTSFVAGMQTAHAMVASTHQTGVQLDLTPLGAYRLLGVPMSTLANQVVAFDVVRGRQVLDLNERLATTPSWSDRFAYLDDALLRWADEGPEPDRGVSWAWNQLSRTHGQVPIGLLADEIGWSHRHFVTRFRDQVGLAPKPTSRVLRFRQACDLLMQPSAGKTIASVAALCGYADHSHLVREFQALAGCTPSAYLQARTAEGFGNPDDPRP